MHDEVLRDVNSCLKNLRNKNYRWAKITLCDKIKDYPNSSQSICRELKSRCEESALNKRELAFCKRLHKDRIKLNGPEDLDKILYHLLRDSNTELVVVLDCRGRKKLYMLGVFSSSDISVPVVYSNNHWLFIVSLNFQSQEVMEILTAFPVSDKRIPLESYIKYLQSRKDENAIAKILLSPKKIEEIDFSI